jgi:5-oxoprolinase (ATP-hydrolysing) subunit A
MRRIDLNSDLGEGFGPYLMGDDEAMLRIVTSANVACGWHAGDPEVMSTTFKRAKELGVSVGAHPGYADLWGFGRRVLPHSTSEVERLIAYQIGAAQALAIYAGHRITHVKVHGALANLAGDRSDVADAIARAIKAVDSALVWLVIAGTEGDRSGERHGLRLAREIFADRSYTDRGTLTPRSEQGAIISDPAAAGQRVLEMLELSAVISTSGKRVPTTIDSICVHSDTTAAVSIAAAVRRGLEEAGWMLRPFAVR